MCEGHGHVRRMEHRQGKGVDFGRAVMAGRVFPLYTCQKKPVNQWMACLITQKTLQSQLILTAMDFGNSILP